MNMKELDKEIERYYKEFKGLPNKNSIVRNNQKNDAFEVLGLWLVI